MVLRPSLRLYRFATDPALLTKCPDVPLFPTNDAETSCVHRLIAILPLQAPSFVAYAPPLSIDAEVAIFRCQRLGRCPSRFAGKRRHLQPRGAERP
jgi:hypothetical protein